MEKEGAVEEDEASKTEVKREEKSNCYYYAFAAGFSDSYACISVSMNDTCIHAYVHLKTCAFISPQYHTWHNKALNIIMCNESRDRIQI